ncbi:protein SFI1 homolog [Anguilla rostrata]|uniref:protein SFI1 homolog n=1 Tax=Anguilla rostrata TaxID=7938 RepID=UPI0030CFFF40
MRFPPPPPAAAFGKWCQARSSAALEQRLVQRGRHLLARRRLQAAFGAWRRGSSARRAAWALLERARKARLSRCLWRWREAVHRRSAWLRCLSRRRALSLSRCLQRWRHALELRRLGVAFITRASPRRRRRARGRRRELRWGVELWGESEPIASPQWTAHCSLDLLLHQAFHTWKDSTHNLQLARVYHVTKELEQVRAALQNWHRLAQQALDAQVHSFCTQLALLDSAPSLGSDSTSPICLFLGTSVGSEQALAVTERCSDPGGEPVHGGAHPVYHSAELGGCTPRSSWQTEQERPLLASPPPGTHAAGARAERADRPPPPGTFRPPDQSGPAHNGSPRLKTLAVSALGRIRRGPVAVAFWQWRALVRVRRGQRALLGSVREVRTRAALSRAFRTWRTGMLEHAAARRHWERSLRSRCLAQWSGAASLRRGKAILRREAERLHTHSLLLRCFSTWRRRGRVKLAFWEPQDSAQLERRVVWLLRRAEKRRLCSGLALWAARARQNLAVRLYHHRAVLTRVFVAWETWAWLARERRLLVLQRLRCGLCSVALDRWRLHTQQQLEVRRRRANRLALQAREILQRWHSYAQSRSRLRRLQCEHVERKRRRMKRTALLSWAEGAERLRRADISAQKSLKIRCLRQWHRWARCGARAGRAVEALETERTRRTLRGAFVLWRERWRSAEQRLLGRVRTAACHWRQRALQSRAEAHRVARLTNCALLRWRHAQARRGERRRRVRGVAREWLRRARQSLARQQEALAFRQRGLRSGLAGSFRRWAAAYRWSLASASFQAQLQRRRVLLVWRRLTVVTLTCRSAVARFQARRQERLTASCFSRWRTALRRAQCRLLVLEQSLSRKHQQATLAVMQRWTTATRGRVMQRNRNKSQLQKLFGCWKEKTEVIKAADALCVKSGRRAAQSLFGVWLRWTKENKTRRQMGEAVWLWVRGRRVSSTFYQWVRVSHQNKEASQLSCTRLLHRQDTDTPQHHTDIIYSTNT